MGYVDLKGQIKGSHVFGLISIVELVTCVIMRAF